VETDDDAPVTGTGAAVSIGEGKNNAGTDDGATGGNETTAMAVVAAQQKYDAAKATFEAQCAGGSSAPGCDSLKAELDVAENRLATARAAAAAAAASGQGATTASVEADSDVSKDESDDDDVVVGVVVAVVVIVLCCCCAYGGYRYTQRQQTAFAKTPQTFENPTYGQPSEPYGQPAHTVTLMRTSRADSTC